MEGALESVEAEKTMKANVDQRKEASKSAAPLLDRRRTRNERSELRGRTRSATTFREILPLAVCGVGPSRILELSTPDSSRPVTTRSRDSHVTPLPSYGYLRSARLYPLGVVENPPLLPQQCLGIISNSRRIEGVVKSTHPLSAGKTEKKRDSRLFNQTIPLVTRDSDGDISERPSRSKSLPKDVALVPTSSLTVELPSDQHTNHRAKMTAKPPTRTPLLVPEKEREQEIRVVEVKQSQHNRHQHRGGEESFLPDISDHSSRAKVDESSNREVYSESERNKISIVSFGTGGGERQERGRHRRRWTLPPRRGGQLSHGWTQTKPLTHLTGVPLSHNTTNDTRTLGKREAVGPTLINAVDSTVSRDCITIDVQEYLASVQQ